MIEKTCRCGAQKKRFYKDIGQFYIGECCASAGFDHRGNSAVDVVQAPVQAVSAVSEPVPTSIVPEPTPQVKFGRGKLRDMRLADLVSLGVERGLVGAESMTKKQLVDALFAQ